MMIRSSIDRRSSIAFHVIAVDPTTGGETLLSEGPAAEAIIAACSIPGIFPGVVLVGSRLSTDIAR
jgi:predicted acylesterase/phospholipase RssA